MYSRFKIMLKYFHYYLTASNGKGHGIHSPFIFQFITRVLNDKHQYDTYGKIENLRRRLTKDKTVLTVKDFGAGSTGGRSQERSISSIASSSVKSKKYGQLLFRIIQYYKPPVILELGTSLGITTAYLASASPGSKVTTLEGAITVAKAAKQSFELLNIKDVEIIEGNFDDTLTDTVSSLSSVDFAFIDGNHRRDPTIRYFQQLLPKITGKSIFVFDDIHWSMEMEDAWGMIRAHPSVLCSVDLFFMGILFFNDGMKEKQHFKIRY